jgi:hypothetical protein
MNMNTATGLITWTPAASQVGAHGVTVRVADPKALATTQSFTVTVAAGTSAEVAPVITSSPITTGKVGQAYRYNVNATDANGGTLTYSLVAPIPAGMAINAATGLIGWTPTAQGTFGVTVRATDPGGKFATQSFSVTVARSGGKGKG